MLAENSDKYQKFEDIYGMSTTEDRPSLQATGDKAADEAIKNLLNASRVCDAVSCGECLMPRGINSAANLSSTEVDAVNQVKEDNLCLWR